MAPGNLYGRLAPGAPEVRVCSFDVFDTCLIRRNAFPTGLFYEVGRRAFSRLGILPSRAMLEDFASARTQAERLARRQSRREDVTLGDIWRILEQSMDWPEDDRLAQCELETEGDSLVAIPAICELVARCRNQGCRIIFVSDMYLPAEFIEGQLRRHGFAETGDRVYVSGQVGKSKASGNLFRHVLEREGVPASCVQHIGDNYHSDYLVPSKLGIRSVLLKETYLTGAEINVVRCACYNPQASGKLAGSMRLSRLMGREERQYTNVLSTQFVAPFVMGFVVWLLQRARAKKIKRLYFFSRDGQLAWKVARQLAPNYGGIDCRYLYVSRQALYLPSATEISAAGMPWMRRFFDTVPLENLLAKLELTFDQVEAFLGSMAGSQRGSYCLASEPDWEKLWLALNEPQIRAKINQTISVRREAARKYFESQGLLVGESWAIVDLGWCLTVQESLWKLLRSFGWRDRIQGLYLALQHGRMARSAAGDSEAIFYKTPMDEAILRNEGCIFANQLLIEHIVGCADHPTVHHYGLIREQPGAIFGKAVAPAALEFCEDLHENVLRFVAENLALAHDFEDEAFCREMLSAIAGHFFRDPVKEAIQPLVSLSVTSDQNGFNSQPIIRPFTSKELLWSEMNNWLRSQRNGQDASCYWREGGWAITPARVKRVARALRRVHSLLGGIGVKLGVGALLSRYRD